MADFEEISFDSGVPNCVSIQRFNRQIKRLKDSHKTKESSVNVFVPKVMSYYVAGKLLQTFLF